MEKETYIKERVDTQIEWYNTNSKLNKRLYQTTKIIEIILAACLTLISGFLKEKNIFPIIVGFVGASITILTTIQIIFKFQEKWTQYRGFAEILKAEKYLFNNKVGKYKSDDSFEIFVEKIEVIITSENSFWQQIQKENKPK